MGLKVLVYFSGTLLKGLDLPQMSVRLLSLEVQGENQQSEGPFT